MNLQYLSARNAADTMASSWVTDPSNHVGELEKAFIWLWNKVGPIFEICTGIQRIAVEAGTCNCAMK